MTASEVVIGVGTAYSFTMYVTDRIEIVYAKTLIKITPGQSSSNWSEGSKDTKIVDLLRIIRMFNIDGEIDSADFTKLNYLIDHGGVVKITYNGNSYYVNFEKVSVIETPTDKKGVLPDMFTVKMSLVEGVNV